MVMTKAAWGSPAAASWRAFTASTISDTAHTSQGPGFTRYQHQVGGADGFGGGPGDARGTVDDHPVITGCQEPHVLEQSSRFYTPHLKAQQTLGLAIGPVQGAALAIGVEQQHLESIRKCASQVGGWTLRKS